jgi:hypothetical protein
MRSSDMNSLSARLILWSLTLFLRVNDAVFSQPTYTVLVAPQASLTRIGVDALASGGASVAERGLATAAFTNPANLQLTGMTAYAEFGKHATSRWVADIDYNGQLVAPAFVSFGVPFENISAQISYFRQYSNRLISPPIPVTTPAFPEGTGEFSTYERSVQLHSFGGSAAIAVNEMVSFGLTIGGNYLKHTENLSTSQVSGSDIGIFAIGGINVAFDGHLTLGASGRYSSSMRYSPERTPASSAVIDSGRPPQFYALERPQAEARIPPVIEIGVSWQALPWLTVLASTEFVNWTSAMNNAENRWQLHIGGIAEVNGFFALRAGFFTLSNPTGFNKEILDQNFLTFGVQLKSAPIIFSLAVMDSHLFKKSLPANPWPYSEPFYQTYVATGLAVTI